MDRKQRHTPWRIYRPTPVTKLIPEDNLLPESLPSQFQSFARDVATFLKCLNDFPEFTDEAVNQSIRAFEGDLKVSVTDQCLHNDDLGNACPSSIGLHASKSIKVGFSYAFFNTSKLSSFAFRPVSITCCPALCTRLDQ